MAEPNNEDARLLVKFYNEPVKMEAKSDEAGRPIFEDREHISIIIPGDTKTNIVRIATDEDRERFAGPYEAFKRQSQAAANGTPLEEWPTLTKSRVKELKSMGLSTVEQLTDLSDASLSRYGDTTDDERAKASAYMAKAADGAAIERYAAKSKSDEEEIARLKAENDRLGALLKDGEQAKGKKAA